MRPAPASTLPTHPPHWCDLPAQITTSGQSAALTAASLFPLRYSYSLPGNTRPCITQSHLLIYHLCLPLFSQELELLVVKTTSYHLSSPFISSQYSLLLECFPPSPPPPFIATHSLRCSTSINSLRQLCQISLTHPTPTPGVGAFSMLPQPSLATLSMKSDSYLFICLSSHSTVSSSRAGTLFYLSLHHQCSSKK